MNFQSILFNKTADRSMQTKFDAPLFIVDLNLDQIVDAIVAGRTEYNLKPFYYTSLRDIDAIAYRHEVMRDLENVVLFKSVKSFTTKMHITRRYLASLDKTNYKYHKEGIFLEAAEIYCEAIIDFVHELERIDLRSRGFLDFRDYLMNYAGSAGFASFQAEMLKLKTDLLTIKYCVLTNGNCIKVRKYEAEIDYSIEVENTFDKFKQGAVKDYRAELPVSSGMNHIEAQILDFVGQLYPEIFAELDNYCLANRDFLDEAVAVFEREIQFYISYLEYVAKLRQAGLEFCYPEITSTSKEVYNEKGFDLALASKLVNENAPVVCNDFYLKDKERILIISGPNQGGKTTFARTFGQLHFLASIGCLVPGRQARLFLFDNLFTHFEKEEDIATLRGKLQDDLVRIYEILNCATANSIIIINEIFTSTTLQDAVFLSRKIMEKLIALDMLAVWVTFVVELASQNEKTVSMVSTVVPENPTLRTYKIIRNPADGLSYAIAIAEKYRLTYGLLKERIES